MCNIKEYMMMDSLLSDGKILKQTKNDEKVSKSSRFGELLNIFQKITKLYSAV